MPERIFPRPARLRNGCRAALLGAALLWTQAAAAEGLTWFVGGQPTPEARQALDMLAGADKQGLAPADYAAEALRRDLSRAATPAELARFDVALTVAMRHFLSDLHSGRIDPHQIQETFSASPPRFDPDATLQIALAGHRLVDALREAAPALPLHARLVQALAHYRALADQPAWKSPLPPPEGRKLEAGQGYAGLVPLSERLIALGDLPAGTAAPGHYEGALVAGIKAFQARHGLAADGVIGKSTLDALNVTPAQRVRQIELNLERLRWTPLPAAPRAIVVNVPEFMLRAYRARDGKAELVASMKVIVGKAPKTPTPIFDKDMRFIEFSPYWNVPPSIARAEIVPRLRRDAGYFEQQGFEFVTRDGRALSALTPGNLDAVLNGSLRIRQRPGPKNALGDIKFIFPNSENIYLHHTPAPGLFGRERRDFSHGCIRVEAPVELAKFVLQDDASWTEERIRDAMSAEKSATLRLREPLKVMTVYFTVAAGEDGQVSFFPDLYGHDKLLDEALRQRRASLPSDQPPAP